MSKPRKFHYMLRRTLPLWKAEETIEEAVEFCRENGIGEVIWKIDVEEFNHGIPELSRIDRYIPWLKRAKERLAEQGILTSINPWLTMNHADRGRDMTRVFPEMSWMMDYTGISAKACACPLSPGWQEWLLEVYRRYASVNPDILWLEDDYRTFNHQPVEWGCYCPLHLKAFSEQIGQQVSRETLVGNMLKPGAPHPMRGQWLDFLGGTMVDIAAKVEQAVHELSPETKLGLMTSHSWWHSAEGRKWSELMRALAGPHEAVARPSLGNYNEINAFGLYYQTENLLRTVFCLPKPYRSCPELENFNYTRFSKSIAFTKAQIALAVLMKTSEITMNLFDHLGSPFSLEPGYGEMLRCSKPYFDALTDRCRPEGKERGVRNLHSSDASKFTVLPEAAGMEDLFPYDNGWMFPLQALGTPVTFEASEVVAVTGQVLRAFKKDIPSLFSGGVLLDLSALETLIDLGYGDLAGVKIERTFQKTDVLVTAEELTDPEFGGANGCYMTITDITASQRMAHLVPGQQSRMISRLVDPDREYVMPGFVLAENTHGGRTAVCPFDLSRGVTKSFLNWNRKEELRHVIKWMNTDKTDLFMEGGAYMIPFRMDYPEYVVFAVMNLSTDRWPNIKATLHVEDRPIRRLEHLQPDGRWTTMSSVKERAALGSIELALPVELGYLELAVFTLHY